MESNTYCIHVATAAASFHQNTDRAVQIQHSLLMVLLLVVVYDILLHLERDDCTTLFCSYFVITPVSFHAPRGRRNILLPLGLCPTNQLLHNNFLMAVPLKNAGSSVTVILTSPLFGTPVQDILG